MAVARRCLCGSVYTMQPLATCVPAHTVSCRQQLRSTASGTLLVPCARTATGQRSFALNGPRTWKPADLGTPDTRLRLLLQGLPVSAVVYVRPASFWLFSEFGAVYSYLLTYCIYAIVSVNEKYKLLVCNTRPVDGASASFLTPTACTRLCHRGKGTSAI